MRSVKINSDLNNNKYLKTVDIKCRHFMLYIEFNDVLGQDLNVVLLSLFDKQVQEALNKLLHVKFYHNSKYYNNM